MAKTDRVFKENRVNDKPIRVSYPTLFKARSVNNGAPAFSLVLMLNKQDPEDMKFLKTLYDDCNAALIEKWPQEANRPRTPVIGSVDSPIKDGDTTPNKKGIILCQVNPEYAGHYIIRANCREDNGRPGVVDMNGQKILDQNEVYGGCYGRVGVNVYTFENQMNAGVTIGLNGFMKTGDGESLGGGRPSTEDMFGKYAGQPIGQTSQPDPFATPPPAAPPATPPPAATPATPPVTPPGPPQTYDPFAGGNPLDN